MVTPARIAAAGSVNRIRQVAPEEASDYECPKV